MAVIVTVKDFGRKVEMVPLDAGEEVYAYDIEAGDRGRIWRYSIDLVSEFAADPFWWPDSHYKELRIPKKRRPVYTKTQQTIIDALRQLQAEMQEDE